MFISACKGLRKQTTAVVRILLIVVMCWINMTGLTYVWCQIGRNGRLFWKMNQLQQYCLLDSDIKCFVCISCILLHI